MTVIAAIDRDGEDARVVEAAEKLAVAFDEPLHLVHVFSRDDFVGIELDAVDRTGRPVDMEEIRSMATDIAEAAAEEVEVEYESIGLMGNVAVEVLEYADEVDASYIVVGGRKRTPVGKALFGSATQAILLEADRPVLAVMAD